MFRAVSVRITPKPSWRFVSFLGAVLLAIGVHTAGAQSSADSTYYAEIWTPKSEKFSLHLDGGLFSRAGLDATSPRIGLRLSKLVGTHLQAGFLTAWTLERRDETQRATLRPGPAPRILLTRVDANVIPFMGFLRVNLTEKYWLVPYVGAGVGYEWLMLEATDYRTRVTERATFSNWAWEGWAGLGIRLGKEARINCEAFYNGATVKRDLIDQDGLTWQELVDLDGVGLRVGVDIIFE